MSRMAWFISRPSGSVMRFGWAVCRFSMILRSSSRSLCASAMSPRRWLLHLVEHAVQVVLRDHPVGRRRFWFSACWFCCAACAVRIRAGTCPSPGATRPSRRLISSSESICGPSPRGGGPAAARNSRSVSERSPSSNCSAIVQSQSATSVEVLVGLRAGAAGLAPARRPMKTPHCGVNWSGAINRASRAVCTRLRSSGSSTSCAAARRAPWPTAW